jgi:general secretion pathway protein D
MAFQATPSHPRGARRDSRLTLRLRTWIGPFAASFALACSTAPVDDPAQSEVGEPEASAAIAAEPVASPASLESTAEVAEFVTEPVADAATPATDSPPEVAFDAVVAPQPKAAAAAAQEVSEITADAELRVKLKMQQLQMQAEETYVMGQKAMERGDFASAELYFDSALNHVRFAPVGVQFGDLEARASAGLEEARRGVERVQSEQRVKLEEAAFERAQRDEMAARSVREQRLASLLEDGIAAFNRNEFDEAERFATQVLEEDPNNPRAKELRASAIEYARSRYNEAALAKRKEEFRRWKQDIEESRIPYAPILNPASKDEWRRISDLRSSDSFLALELDESPQDREVRARLANTTIESIQFPDMTLTDAATGVSIQSGIPIVVDPEVAAELDSSGVVLNISPLRSLAVRDILNILTQQAGEGITYSVKHGVVLITKTDKLSGEAIPRIHTVQDLTFRLVDFKSPRIGQILPPGAEISEEEGSVFGSEEAGEVVINPEEIITLIKENIAPGTWDTGAYSIGLGNNDQILVIHSPEVHGHVAQFLDDLRRFSSTVVTIESRFVNIRDDFLQEIGVDWRGLGGSSLGTDVTLGDVTYGEEDNAGTASDSNGPGLGLGSGLSPVAGAFFNDGGDGDVRAFVEHVFEDSLGKALSTTGGASVQISILDGLEQYNLVIRAIEKSQFVTEVSAPILTVFNTQRSFVTVVNQVSYIQDFDVDVANSAFIANPNVGVLQEGVVLDVRPTISYDRKYITLEIQATVANILRPIRTFSTSLSGLTIPVTFQLPELEVQQANSTVRVPDGGSMVMGGLKRLRYVNRTAEVPWLGRIPVIGAVFREKGLSDERGSLILVVKADITDLSPFRDNQYANLGG